MVNFKVGDIVVYTGNNYTGRQIQPGVPKVVQSVSPCGEYLRVCRDDNGKVGGYPKKDFYLFQEEQDDPLPPAPESVRYATMQYEWQGAYNDQHLTVSRDTFNGTLKMHVQGNTNSTRNKNMSLSVLLDADGALNLAHDLTRMAMEIRRKERNGN